MQRQDTDQFETGQEQKLSAEQFAKLLKEKDELKTTLEQISQSKASLEKTLQVRNEQITSLQTSSLNFQSQAGQRKEQLKQAQEDLRKARDEVKTLQKENDVELIP